MKQLVLFLSILLVFTACASKRYLKKGLELENSGLYSDAANQYYNSLVKNINNIDAKIGLQRTGQLVLDDYIEKFKNQYNNGTSKDAVYAFINAENYYNKIKKVGLNLIFPEEQRSYYKEVQDIYLSSLYEDAIKALELEEFASSEKIFSEVLSLNNNYKDAKSKWIIAKYEPVYREGKQQMNSDMFRSSYFTFKNIIDNVKVYEDALELMNTSLERAKLTIAVKNFEIPYSSYETVSVSLKSKLINGINNLNSPLYEVVSNTVKQNDPFSSVNGVSSPIAIEKDRDSGLVKNYTGVNTKAVFTGKVLNYKVYNGKLAKREKRGYLERTVEYVDKETGEKKKKKEYDKVKYYEYEMTRYVSMSFEYNMKRTDRVEVPLSNVFTDQETDELHYVVYEGDYKKLVPGYWKYTSKDSSEDYISNNSTAINNLRDLVKSNRTAKSSSELQKDLIDKCVHTIVSEISNYKPEN